MELLDQVFAYQESTHDELQAGADESFNVWLVSLVQRHCNRHSDCFLPLSLEIFPPLREFMKAADIIQHDFELSVICWRKFRNQNPCKQVETGQTEVMEVVPLHAPPTTRHGE